jgi:Domain of unknown function (DUF4157)
MESQFNHDFSEVRTHTDSTAATSAQAMNANAYTVGQHVIFGEGQFGTRRLLKHELTHIVQQNATPSSPQLPSTIAENDHCEAEARASETAILPIRQARSSNQLQRQPRPGSSSDERTVIPPGHGSGDLRLAEAQDLQGQVYLLWETGQGKAEVFNYLRFAPQPQARNDMGLRDYLAQIFASQADDAWLAETIRLHGSEPHWPSDALRERERRARSGAWPSERGNIEGVFNIGPGQLPVRTYFFPGQTSRRAMIIGGVHGSEVSGVEVVENLLARMRASGAQTPYFSLIVIPRLFPERVAQEMATRRTPGTNSNAFRESGEFANLQGSRTEIPTNRNFPTPTGATPEAVRHAATSATQDDAGLPILQQNRILLDLIDRFQPERIASVHANRRATGMRRGGPGSGVFVDPAHPTRTSTLPDPRVEDRNANRDHPQTAEDRLTANMARRVVNLGGRAGGNFVETSDRVGQTRYDPAGTLHNQGQSLGTWGPRAGMTIITVEVPWYEASSTYPQGRDREGRQRELQAYATSLEEVFLGPNDEAASSP